MKGNISNSVRPVTCAKCGLLLTYTWTADGCRGACMHAGARKEVTLPATSSTVAVMSATLTGVLSRMRRNDICRPKQGAVRMPVSVSPTSLGSCVQNMSAVRRLCSLVYLKPSALWAAVDPHW